MNDVTDGWHAATVACETVDCPKNGEQVTTYIPDVPSDWGWLGVVCGVCRQLIPGTGA